MYLTLFETYASAVGFEAQCLSIGNEFLPDDVQAERDDVRLVHEPRECYWLWLIAQHKVMMDELEIEPEENTHGRGL
jgi:hypothetical protein